MAYRLHVDHDRCVSSGACVLEAPDAFALQDGPEALAVVLPGADDLDDEEKVTVAGVCPVEAIRVTDEDGNEVPVSYGG